MDAVHGGVNPSKTEEVQMAEAADRNDTRYDALARLDRATDTVRHYAWWASGWGLLPLPMVDALAQSAVQLRMLKRLSEVYGVPFSYNRGKAIVAALVGGVVPTTLSRGAMGLLVRSIPVVGPLIGMVTTPAFDFASTYAVGKVFIEHYESGGAFLELDPDRYRDAYTRYYQEGREMASKAAARQSADASAAAAGQPRPAKA